MISLIDIETLPADAVVGMDLDNPPGWEPSPPRVERRTPPSNWRDPAKIAAWEEREEARYRAECEADAYAQQREAVENWRRSVFNWRRVRIGCIGLMRDGVPVVLDCEANGEADQLRSLLDLLPASGPILTWGDYDARILRSRMMARRIGFGPLGVSGKPWTRRVVDLQRIFAEIVEGNPSRIKGISVDNACDFLGIERTENPISGAEVLDAYVGGRWGEVIAHCAADIRDEWEIAGVLAELGVRFHE